MSLPGDLLSTINFDQTTNPFSFKINDVTNYAGDSISPNDVRGVYKVTDPNGNIIHNNTSFATPDILGSSTLQYSGLPIPLDINGNIVNGTYIFNYSVVTDNPIVGINTGSKTFSVAGNVVALIPAASSVTVVRSGAGNNGTYTVVGTPVFSGGNTVITVSQVIPSGTFTGSSLQYAGQQVFSAPVVTATYSNVVPAISIEQQADCFGGILTSTDETNYNGATLNSRVHTVYYPAALKITPIVSSNAVITVSPIYTQTWTTTITSNITVPLPGGGTTTVNITGSQDIVVSCDLSFCQITCCVNALNNRYLANLTSNPPQAEIDFINLTRVTQLMLLFGNYYKCGLNDLANAALAEIQTVANCIGICNCNNSEVPQQVVPLSSTGSNSTVVVTSGTGIQVSTTVNGNIVTYAVRIADSTMAFINSLAPVNVVGGTGITVTMTVVGGVNTFTVTNSAAYTAQNRMEFQCLLEYTNPASPTLTIVNSNYLTSGSNMEASATVADPNIANPNWAAMNNLINVSAFQVSGNAHYKVDVEKVVMAFNDIVGTTLVASYTEAQIETLAENLKIRVLQQDSGDFNFQFVDGSGMPISNQKMTAYNNIIVNIKISE